VAIEIVHDIMADGLRTGDRLPLEAAMVDQYRISRASLREALRLLEVQGLIRLKPGPGGGPVVGTVDPANLARTAALYFHLSGSVYQDLLQTQALVEPLCAQLACDHPDRTEALEPFTTVPDEPLDEVEYRDFTVGFHRTIYELADNPVLTILSGAVTHIVTDHVVATMDPVELRPRILEEHAEMARTIIKGEHAGARRLMTEHFERQHRYYAEHWPSRLRQLIEWR
jgi:DNA-binding FadR family transcriptional regulator